MIKVIENQQNRIDELEKALIDEDFKNKEKISKAIKRIKETRLDYTIVGQEVLEILEG